MEDYSSPINKVHEPYQALNFDRRKEAIRERVRKLKETDKEPEASNG